jgi:hypothetical protein
MKSLCRRLVALGCFFAAVALDAQTTRPLRVLFIGNSLTAGHDVPGLVQAMAELHGVNLQVTMMAPGGYAIEDHWNDGNQRLLETGNYHVVVLQQGPSTLFASQANLRQWAITWANHARRFGARPALYMVWPVRGQDNGFALVSQSYRNAAIAADTAIFPAGEAWQQAMAIEPTIALYEADDLHALPAGSFLAAMVIGRGLFNLDPDRVPERVAFTRVSAKELASFRSVVRSLPSSALGDADSPGATAPTPIDPTTVTRGDSSPPTPTAPANPAPTAATTPASSGGGGGAPSLWFLCALLAAAAARQLPRRR